MAVRDAFIDTSVLYAVVDKRDAYHAAARDTVGALLRSGRLLVTSDDVVAETITRECPRRHARCLANSRSAGAQRRNSCRMDRAAALRPDQGFFPKACRPPVFLHRLQQFRGDARAAADRRADNGSPFSAGRVPSPGWCGVRTNYIESMHVGALTHIALHVWLRSPVDRGKSGRKEDGRIGFREHRRGLTKDTASASTPTPRRT